MAFYTEFSTLRLYLFITVTELEMVIQFNSLQLVKTLCDTVYDLDRGDKCIKTHVIFDRMGKKIKKEAEPQPKQAVRDLSFQSILVDIWYNCNSCKK